MKNFNVEQSDLIGEIEGFPIEVVEKMVYYQFMQKNSPNVRVFQLKRDANKRNGGFNWDETIDDFDFWQPIIMRRQFNTFFNKYPKQTMEEKSIKINIPEGYEIDKYNSSFSEIKFKPIENKYPKDWDEAFIGKDLAGYFISRCSDLGWAQKKGTPQDYTIFKTEKQAKSAIAYAQLTQLMALPCYNGDWKPDWNDDEETKYIIRRVNYLVEKDYYSSIYHPISFKSSEICDIFYTKYMDLLKDYFEIR